MPETTRFAPSPTGFIHLGHVASALIGHERALGGGRFLLRIEDIDTTRCKPQFIDALEEDLGWLGLRWEKPVRYQSKHMADYGRVITELESRGLVYPCFCSRSRIALEVEQSVTAPHHAPDGSILYPGTCRDLSQATRSQYLNSGAPHVLRLDMNKALAQTGGELTWLEEGIGRVSGSAAAFGDVVIARRDAPASYHLCATHDDALAGVTLVTRGKDLFEATSIQRVLQCLMGWNEPRYAHHDLLCDSSGRRLSKRDGDISVRALREQGMTPTQVCNAARNFDAMNR